MGVLTHAVTLHPSIAGKIQEHRDALAALLREGRADEQEYARQYAIYLNTRKGAIATAAASATIAAQIMAASQGILVAARQRFGYHERQSMAQAIEVMVAASQLPFDLPPTPASPPPPAATVTRQDLADLPLPSGDTVL